MELNALDSSRESTRFRTIALCSEIAISAHRSRVGTAKICAMQDGATHCYKAYGLTLSSAIPLPELPAGTGPVDVAIRVGRVTRIPDALDERGAGFWVAEGQACHFRKEAGAFLASGGTELLVDPNPTAPPEVVRLSILGPGLGLILQQRGVFALHGSAVVMDGAAVVFLGQNGAGKSTMAALMHARGHRLLADDVTPLDIADEDIRVVPSFPQIKLWPDSASVVGSAEQMPVLHPSYEKRALRPAVGFSSEPVALRRLYVLQGGATIELQRVDDFAAVQYLMACWYGARFGSAFARAIDQRAHFVSCTRLAKRVPVRVLRRPATLGKDPDLAAKLEAVVLTDLAGGL